jgi:PAS domain S-box-containing protein
LGVVGFGGGVALVLILTAGAFILNLMVRAKTREIKVGVDALESSERRLRSTLDSMLEGYQLIGFDFCYLYINPAAALQGRYEKDEYIGKSMMELYPGIEKTEMFQMVQKCMREHSPDRIEHEFPYPDGTKSWFAFRFEPVPEGVLVLSVDISERKNAESEIEKINRMLRTISECNQVLVRTDSEADLLARICNIIVKSEGYPLAWVGFSSGDEGKTVYPAAQAGDISGYLKTLKISWGNNEFGRGPTGKAIRTGKPCIARISMAEPDYSRWVVSAAKHGFKSSVALPLINNGNTYGSLNIYSTEEDTFNEEQLGLLIELADDLAYGIAVLRRRCELDIATQNLMRSEKKYSTLVEQSNDGIIVIQGREIEFANQQVLKMTGFSMEETIGKTIADFVSFEYKGLVADRYTRRISGEDVPGRYEIKITGKDGSDIPVEINASAIEHEGLPAVMAIIRDITERKKAEESLKESEERFRNFAQSTHELIQSIDADGDIQFVNKAWHDILGYSEEDLKEITLEDIIHPDSIEHCFSIFHEVMSGKLVPYVEAKFKARDGHTIYVEGSAAPRFLGDKVIATQGFYADVTERKKAEEALRQEKDYAQSIVNTAQTIILTLDAEGRIVNFNQYMEKISGYTAAEVKGKNWIDTFLPERTRQKTRELFSVAISDRNTMGNIDVIVTKSGQEKLIEWYDTTIKDNYGKITGLLAVGQDVTERMEAEERMQRSEEKYRTLFETMEQGLIFWDRNGKLISANRAAEHIFGLTLEQMQGKTSVDIKRDAIHEDGSLFPEDMHPSILALKTGKPVRDVVIGIFNPREKEYRWVVSNAMPQFKEGAKEPHQVYTTFTDITRIKHIEEALYQSEKKLRASLDNWETTFNSINDAICLLSLDGTIIRCNKAMNDIVGRGGKDIVGENCHKLVHGTGGTVDKCPHLKMIQSGHREAFEVVVGDRWYHIVADPIFNGKGEVAGSVHIMENITERKKMEERLMMTDRLASIGELSSGIAHELNNPLTGVLGMTQLLLARKDIADDVLNDLQMVNGEAQRAARVVKNLLVFARKHPHEAQLSSITQAVEKVLELRAYEQKVNNIRVIKDFAPDLPQIVIDYFQIQQVFLNIIINAEFAMTEAHKEGMLIIRANQVGDMVRMSFEDNGPGITKENLPHVFDPFFTTKEVGKGTGLGLSICHGIILQHGGNIYAESEFGKGATFVIELPVNPPEQVEEVYNGNR